MSRKPPTDTFTRFTSTTPSFQSQSPPSFTSQPPSSPTPQPSQKTTTPNETPRERVARLRAERTARLASELSTTDRLLTHGRRLADIAHRGTTYTLLGFSALATIAAAYGLVSLVSHNRTQKRAWIEREMDRLEGARAAFLKGTADAEQLHLLEQERAGEELKSKWEEEKRRKKEEGWMGWMRRAVRGKGSMGLGGDRTEGDRTLSERARELKRSEGAFERGVQAVAGAADVAPAADASVNPAEGRRFTQGGREVELRPAAVEGSAVRGVGLDEKGRPVPMGKMQAVPVTSGRDQPPVTGVVAVAGQGRRGGQLDMLAENITLGAQSTSSSWWNSIFGGSRS
ncbi:hypothetical protein PMZ80_008063 [Knufia obscura]|uniref:Cytochrome oxidase c assembly-domain-containing protein n=1 Tax=Knufia obscura TaxID=1635080 RepID=A0ABR0RHM6_9EURO|nr:hypothetical protein PMZ80_008063 [Knufia obscura]